MNENLVIEYMPLARKLAKLFSTIDGEEALGEAFVGLAIAAEKFDEKRGPYFAPFARTIILNRLKGRFNAEVKEAPSVDFQAAEQHRGDDQFSGDPSIENAGVYIKAIDLAAPDCFSGIEVLQTFKSWVESLEPHKKALIAWKLKHLSQDEIALKMSSSQTVVSRELNSLQRELEQVLYA